MAGYSPNPLIKKLGFKEGADALLIAVPHDLQEISAFQGFAAVQHTLSPEIAAQPRHFDIIHWFETSRARLADQVAPLSRQLKADGMLWISWPKKSSKRLTDITEDVLRKVILPLGLVDVKVCAVDETWSGLKFMWRKETRATLS